MAMREIARLVGALNGLFPGNRISEFAKQVYIKQRLMSDICRITDMDHEEAVGKMREMNIPMTVEMLYRVRSNLLAGSEWNAIQHDVGQEPGSKQ